MSILKLLQLKDNLTIAEACDYLAGLAGVEDNNTFNYIAGLVNDYKLNLYLNPDRFYEAPYADCGIEYSEVTLIGEQKFIKVCLLRYLTRFDKGVGVAFSQECSIFIDEGSKIEGDVFAGKAFEFRNFEDNYIPSYLNDDEIAEAHSLACKTHKNKVSEFTEGLHQTDKDEDLFRIDGSNFLYIKRKEIDALLESLPAKSASQTDQTELEKQLQEKVDMLSAKIEQLESENKELKTLAKEPTKSVYTLTGALLKLLVDHRKPKRNQTSIVTELVDLAKAENIEGLSKPNIDKFFIVAKKHLEDATDKG